MNVVLPINNYCDDNLCFLDSKKNIITEGIFTKIIYSNKLFVMNGIFLYFPIDADNIINSNGRYFINFNPSSSYNCDIIQKINIVEDKILNFYIKSKNISKNKHFILTNQLNTGNIKVYRENNIHSQNLSYSNKLFILKISGIWENDTDFGITYKIIIAKKFPVFNT